MNILHKLASRKFLCCMAGTAIGVLSVLYLDGTLTDIAGILTAVSSLIAYIKSEAEVDKAAIQNK